MYSRRLVVVTAALAMASCFAVEPLPTCKEIDGLFAPYHVCMPRSGVSIPLEVAPRQLLAGNFDGASAVADDLALLADETLVIVFTSAGLALDPPVPSAGFLAGGTRVDRMTASRFYEKASPAEDIFTVSAPSLLEPGRLVGWPNQGGDVPFDQDSSDTAFIGTKVTCPEPTGVQPVFQPGGEVAAGLLVACPSGTPGMTKPGISGYLFPNVGGSIGAFSQPVTTKYAQVRAGAVASIDGLGLDDFIFSFRAPGVDGGEAVDDHLGVVLIGATPDDFSLDPVSGTALEIPLASGGISVVIADDLDEDADVDIVAVHPDAGVISIVRQKRSEPLTFEAPELIPIGAYIDDVILGDFSADGHLDLAVAHAYADTGISVISFLIRQPDALPGSTAYGFAPATFGLGEIADLEAIDLDSDGRLDIAAAFKTGKTGSIEVYLNRSPAGV